VDKIIYSDGNANTWIISPSGLEYIPVTPQESSSGIYSGGVPVNKTITSLVYQKICEATDTIFRSGKPFLVMRTMGSVQIRRIMNDKEETVILVSEDTNVISLRTLLDEYIR